MPMTVIDTSDAARWDQIVGGMPHDVYHLHAFHALAERRGEGQGFLFVYEEGPFTIAVPLLLRSVHDVVGHDRMTSDLTDATSVHGYAGPVSTGPWPPEALRRHFLRALTEALRERHVVTAFSRLNPLLPQHHLLEGLGSIVRRGATVVVDLAASDDHRRRAYRRDTRRSLRRLEQAGARAHVDTDLRQIGDFIDLYLDTMDRVHAQPGHRLCAEDLHDLARTMRGRMFHVMCTLDDTIVAAGLYTMCDGIVQAHLGATRTGSLSLAPARLEIDTAMSYARAAGNRVFHLGGGVGANADSLFAFKRGFGPTVLPFFGWQVIVDRAAYDQLVFRAGAGENPSGEDHTGFFPAYRAPRCEVAAADGLVTGGTR
jgi:hypothetical protein